MSRLIWKTAAAVIAIGLLLPTANATAGIYEVTVCGGYPSPTAASGWQRADEPGTVAFNRCGDGQNGFGARLERHVQGGHGASWTFDAPSGTTIAGLRMHRTATASGGATGPQRAYKLYRDRAEEGYLIEKCVVDAADPCRSKGDEAHPFGDRNLFAWSGGATRLIGVVRCIGVNPCETDPADGRMGSFEIYRATIGLLDDQAPQINLLPQGGLTGSTGPLTGVQALYYGAGDRGGGVAQHALVIDGKQFAAQPATGDPSCRAPYTVTVPCPSAVNATLSFDTSALTDGEHTVQLVVLDAAGNRTASPPWTITTRNHVVSSANGNNASQHAQIEAGFSTRRGARRSLAVGYGRTPVVEGRLMNRDNGQPIAGAAIEVATQTHRPGATARGQGTVLTDASGRFRYQLRRGASRTVQLAYRAFSLDPTASASAGLRLTVRAGVRLTIRPRTVRNAGSIRFRGRLLGGPGRRGTAVVIYVADPGGRGRIPVTTVRADRRGRFSARYRFRRTVSTVRFRFYARYQRQSGYPYASASSRKVSVKVTP